MVLSDGDIKKALAGGRIKISPKPNLAEQLGSCMIDLRLGTVYRVFNHSKTPYIDPQNPKTLKDITTEVRVRDGEAFTLHPGEFILAVTKEYIEMPDDLTGRLEGRSSIGRLGVGQHRVRIPRQYHAGACQHGPHPGHAVSRHADLLAFV